MLSEASRARFLALIETGAPDECWPWLGSRLPNDGRGTFYADGQNYVASRLALMLDQGAPPSPRHFACHTCDNPPCCNPAHLWWGTQRENMRDAASKMRIRQQHITHCPKGHPLSGDNVLMAKGTHRQCKQCKGDRQRRLRSTKPKLPRRLKSHCNYGHALAGDNLLIHRDGHRYCRTCKLDQQRARRAELALAQHQSPQSSKGARSGVYVASRASIPERGEMWRRLRSQGIPINSTWIDEDGPKASRDLAGLWERIRREVTSAEFMVLYVEPDDFPLKGALIEAGMALAAQVPIRIVAPGVELEPRNCRPLGSWVKSPLISFHETLSAALALSSNLELTAEKEGESDE